MCACVYERGIYSVDMCVRNSNFLSLFFSSLPIRERRKALMTRSTQMSSSSPSPTLRDGQHHKNGETTTRLFFEEKDASSLLPAPVFRGKARDARSQSPSFGGVVVVVFFVRVFYLSSLFAMVSRPHPTKKRCEHHLTTVFFDGKHA